MERDFGIALVLNISCFCSLVVTVYRWTTHRGLSLPLEEEPAQQSSIQAAVFDVAKVDDFSDGQPVDEVAFWTRIRPRKLALALVLATVVFIASVTEGKIEYYQVAFPVYTAYLAFLAALSVATTDRTAHAYYTTTLAVLSTSAFIILLVDFIIPSPSVSNPGRRCHLVIYLAISALALTMPRGPQLYYPPQNVYAKRILNSGHGSSVNVNGVVDASVWGSLFFSYISKVAMLPPGFGVADLPILTAAMRAPVTFSQIRSSLYRSSRLQLPAGMRFGLAVLRANAFHLIGVQLLSALTAVARCSPAYFMRLLLLQLEREAPVDIDSRWGLVYVAGLFAGNLVFALGWGQIWNLVHIAGIRIVSQTTTLLFVKTLVRKEAAAGGATAPKSKQGGAPIVHKAEILTLMSQDVHRVSDLSKHVYTLTDSPIQLVLSTWILYSLLGISCFVGLAATMICLPLQHFTGNMIFRTQSALMKAKDERITLTNEILGGIRMIKFMAWERKFEDRILEIRDKELLRQKITYVAKTLLTIVGNFIPLLFALASFGHYTIIRHQTLTPSVAFTAITIFNTIQYAISGFPEALIAGLQCLISLRRIDQYLETPEVAIRVQPGSHLPGKPHRIFLSSASIRWPSFAQSESNTPFELSDLSLEFPVGELSLICGKVGSGKSLLLLGLLGEADITAGCVECPRSAPDFLSNSEKSISPDGWIVAGVCAYVPQTSWLQNQSIRDNILFELPYCAERYIKTLEACALVPDLEILEYGDMSEVGERGINLSGGQKARVSLARAVYSRASILILDDILSAVDVHTAHHIYHACIKGDLMRGRTVILVSHHIQLCADGAAYVVALDRGSVKFRGAPADFRRSEACRSLLQAKVVSSSEIQILDQILPTSGHQQPAVDFTSAKTAKILGKAPKFVADELSSVGRIPWTVWTAYLRAAGHWPYWFCFTVIMLIASLGPVFENSYLRTWADAGEAAPHGPIHFLAIYAAIMCFDLLLRTAHFFMLYAGSICASEVLYKNLFETVLFSPIKFHDTAARGNLLNRFGKDFQIIDGFIADDFARAAKLGLSVAIIFVTMTFVGGLPFLCAAVTLGLLYYFLAQDYAHTSRDMRRLVSTTTSPLYSIYETAISGVLVIRSFGASTTFLRDLMRAMDANSCACHWQYGLNRWFSVLSMTFAGTIVTLIGLVILLSPAMDPSLAGMALVFASMISADLLYFVRAFVGLEQCLVAVERVKETSDLPREPPEILEPRPPANWPSKGAIVCQDLSVRYSPELPNVLHGLNFEVLPGEKIGIVGRTGSGKSTLALSFFRFVEASRGALLIDGIDIASLGLSDLRRNLTIIPQDPTLMSGTLRSTLDVFNEHQDAEIFEALRSVHLLSRDSSNNLPTVFNDLDSRVSHAGSNFSAGEKQLLCLARAILKHAKVLILDEATASVDYATDELIGLAIHEKFSSSTVFTIAHRLRSVIDYEKVMVLEEGRIVEFESPKTLLEDESSKFHALCKATGSSEFATLKSMVRARI